jgi:LCP family protein required for cell wall assembly
MYNNERHIRVTVRKKGNKSKTPFIWLIVLALCFAIFVEFYPFAKAAFSIRRESFAKAKINKGLSLPSTVHNIAVFGVDARAEGEDSRSDAILILSIDRASGKATVASVLRDTFCAIPGHDPQKINAAYFYGGPALAVETLNRNFDLNIKDYISIDFLAVAAVVDSLGGIELTVEKGAVSDMNQTIKTTNRILGGKPSPSVEAGAQLLDGKQAVAFARMRNSGAADFDRTGRQRELFSALAAKVREGGWRAAKKAVAALAPNAATSLGVFGMASLASRLLPCLDSPIASFGLTKPLADKTVGGSAVLFPNDLAELSIRLHASLYGEESGYEPTAALEELSEQLYNYR